MEARRVWRIAGEGSKGGAAFRESAILLWSAICLFLLGAATVAVTNVAETLFLKRIGVELLPQVFLLNSVLLAVSTFLVGRRAARADRGQLLTLTLLLLAFGVLVLWAASRVGVPGAVAALVVSAKQIQAVGLLVFWVALGGWLDGRQAKRLFPPIMAGGTLGTLAGSFASAPIGRALGIPALLLLAAAAIGGAALATLGLRRAAPARLESGRPARPRRSRRAPSPASIWRQSGLFRLLATATFLGGLLAPVLYYQFSAVADAATRGADGEQRLLTLFSQFRGFLNLGVLLLQVAGTSWLFQRIGVPLASLIAPVVYVVGVLALGQDAALSVGVVAMAAATLQDHALQEPAERTLATLFPERIRPAAAALIEGPIKRSGGVLGNLLVMAALGLGGAVAVSYAAAPLAVLWLVVVLALWRVYPSLLLEGARSRRSDVALPLTELLDARTLRVLEAPLTDPDRQRCRAACALLREAGGARVVIAVARALAIAPAENRGLLLGTLAQLLEQGTPLAADEGAQVRASLAQAIARPDGLDDMERAGLVQGYARVGQGDAKGAIDLLDRCRDDPSPTVRLAAEIVLAGSRDGHVLAEAIRDPNLQRRRVAQQDLRLELLLTSANGDRSGAFEHRLMLLAGLLESPEDRAAAAGALADVAARHGAHALPAAPLFLAQRTSDDTAVRTALLRFIGHAGLVSEARWALSRLNARSREEGRAAAESLTRLAPGAMDVILEAANSGGRRQRQAVVPILRALAVADETLAALVSSELEAARRARALTRALASGPISPLVLQRLGERVEEALSSILALLAAREAEPRLAELGALLERVRDGRDRAALLEAMDALLPSEESAPLLALLDDSEPSATTPRGAAGPGGAGASFEEALRSALEDEDELTRHFLAATLDEGLRARLGVASAASAAAAPLAPAPAASEARRGGEDVANLSEVEIVLHLRSLSLFERLRTRQLGELAGIVREVTRPPGNVIVTEGDFAECMYLIVSGTVHISREGRRLAELGPRDFFGEMAVLDGELRSATVIAATRVHLLRIDRADLLGVMDEHPGIAITICQALSRRVRSLNDEVRELRRSRSV